MMIRTAGAAGPPIHDLRDPGPQLRARDPRLIRNGATTILVVDDEEMLRTFITKVLEQKGYRVLTASDGSEALRICEERHDEIDLLLTDVIMPRMSGSELAVRARQSWPEIPLLLISGYLREAVPTPSPDFLQKPFTMDQLAGKVEQILAAQNRSNSIVS